MIPWMQAVVSLAIGLLAAGGAFLGVRLNVRSNERATDQREQVAAREEWGRQFRQACDYLTDGSPRKVTIGLEMIAALIVWATPEDCRMAERVVRAAMKDRPWVLEEMDRPGGADDG